MQSTVRRVVGNWAHRNDARPRRDAQTSQPGAPDSRSAALGTADNSCTWEQSLFVCSQLLLRGLVRKVVRPSISTSGIIPPQVGDRKHSSIQKLRFGALSACTKACPCDRCSRATRRPSARRSSIPPDFRPTARVRTARSRCAKAAPPRPRAQPGTATPRPASSRPADSDRLHPPVPPPDVGRLTPVPLQRAAGAPATRPHDQVHVPDHDLAGLPRRQLGHQPVERRPPPAAFRPGAHRADLHPLLRGEEPQVQRDPGDRRAEVLVRGGPGSRHSSRFHWVRVRSWGYRLSIVPECLAFMPDDRAELVFRTHFEVEGDVPEKASSNPRETTPGRPSRCGGIRAENVLVSALLEDKLDRGVERVIPLTPFGYPHAVDLDPFLAG